jgi:hypothetical protein
MSIDELLALMPPNTELSFVHNDETLAVRVRDGVIWTALLDLSTGHQRDLTSHERQLFEGRGATALDAALAAFDKAKLIRKENYT